jgi:hypothetical protein
MIYLMFFVFGATSATIASHYIHVGVFKAEVDAAKDEAAFFEKKWRELSQSIIRKGKSHAS